MSAASAEEASPAASQSCNGPECSDGVSAGSSTRDTWLAWASLTDGGSVGTSGPGWTGGVDAVSRWECKVQAGEIRTGAGGGEAVGWSGGDESVSAAPPGHEPRVRAGLCDDAATALSAWETARSGDVGSP